MEGTNIFINSSMIKTILKNIYFFNNISLASKLRIIKASSKSNITIIWIDIWNSQSSMSIKTLINHCFNVGSHIAIIHSTNMSSEVSQYKNCWKWGHTIFACWAQGLKYIKCNSPYKIKHHHHFAWCCKVNFKTNTPCFETKQRESCSHSFKYLNCKGDH